MDQAHYTSGYAKESNMKRQDAESMAMRTALSIFAVFDIQQKIEADILIGVLEIKESQDNLRRIHQAAIWLGYIPEYNEDETTLILKWR